MGLKYSFLIATALSALFFGLPRWVASWSDDKCIQVFYDSKKESRAVQKYLQGFPEYRQIFADIESYESGTIDKCQTTFYVNSREDGVVPRVFSEDYVSTSRNVIWVGANIWQLGERLERAFGLRYIGLAHLTTTQGGELLFRGKVFKERNFSSRQIELLPVSSEKFEVLAGFRRSMSRELVPYVVRSQNRFFVAELPGTEGLLMRAGREQVLADLFGEMVGVPPQLRARSISSNSR